MASPNPLHRRRWLGSLALAGTLLTTAFPVFAGPIRKGPWVQRVTATTALVRVEVDPPQPVQVEIGAGASGDGGARRTLDSSEPKSLHTLAVSGLEPESRYTYVVHAGATTKMAAFVTAPRTGSVEPFRFLVYGDNRTDDAGHAAVVRAMVPVPADFLVHTGDFVENGASTAQWQTFFDIEAPLLGSRCLYSAVGNHELTDGAGVEYTKFFGPTDPPAEGSAKSGRGPLRPEHFDGTFRWGNARFFLVNGMVSLKQGALDRSWLEKALGEADAEPDLRWRIVVIHHGLWSSGPHGGNARLHEAGIPALLREHKVDLLLAGHDHIYERGFGEGIAYLVSGGGGAPVYRVKSPGAFTSKVEPARHFVEATVTAASIRITAKRMDGSTLDTCSLSKNPRGWDCDVGATSAPPEAAPSASTSRAPGHTPPTTSRCACAAPGAVGSSPLDVVLVGAGASGLWMRRRAKRRPNASSSRRQRT